MDTNNKTDEIELDESTRLKILNRQLKKIYQEQRRRKKAQERRRKFLDKWGYVFACLI
jgi:hypothetical protein